MPTALLDTSVLAAFLDARDALHAPAEQTLGRLGRDRWRFAMSTVSWAELLVGVRLGHHSVASVEDLRSALAVRLIAVDQAVAERAAELRAGHRGRPALKLPDAIVLATADVEPDVHVVVTGDRRWQAVSEVDADVIELDAG